MGFVYKTGDLKKEIIGWVEKYDHYGKKIQITGYIEHTDLDENVIKNQRKAFIKQLNDTIALIKKYLPDYSNIVEFNGFIAQITTPDPKQGGKPKERGLVDIHGNIIYER